MIDPDLAAILLTVLLACLGALVSAGSALRGRRKLRDLCVSCGRRILLGERTCDCDS